MKKIVAVEEGLTPVKEYLSSKGYDVVTASQNNLDSCAAIVVTGLDSNVMGIEDTTTKAPVIRAHGMSPEEVYKAVEQKVK